MFCSNCGASLAEGTKFCPTCGATQAAPAPEVPVSEVSAPELPVYQNHFASPSFEPQPEQPKKKKWILPVAIAGGLIAVLVVLGIVFWDSVNGFWLRNFGSTEDYLVYVEKKSIGEPISELTDLYGKFKNPQPQKTEGEVTIVLSDDAKQMAGSLLSGYDVENLEDASIQFVTNNDGENQATEFTLMMGETKALQANLYADGETGDVYLTVPTLNQKTFHIPMQRDENSAMIHSILSDSEFLNALPEEEVLNELLMKYINIALTQIKDVEKTDTIINIEGIEQSVIELRVEITEETALNITKAVLEAVREDKELREALLPAIEYVAEEMALFEDAEDLYDEVLDAIDDALEELDETEFTDEDPIVFTNYVDGDHKIIARRIEADGEELFFGTIQDGNDTATMITVSNQFRLTGSGTKDGSKLSGTYTLTMNQYGQAVCLGKIELIDVDTAKDTLNGTIRIRPDADLFEKAGMSGSMTLAISAMNPALEFTASGDEEGGTFAINLLSNDEVLFGLQATATVREPDPIELPEGGTNNLPEWLESIDPNATKQLLEDIGLSDLYSAQNATTVAPNYYY